jgi:hypothetical protein
MREASMSDYEIYKILPSIAITIITVAVSLVIAYYVYSVQVISDIDKEIHSHGINIIRYMKSVSLTQNNKPSVMVADQSFWYTYQELCPDCTELELLDNISGDSIRLSDEVSTPIIEFFNSQKIYKSHFFIATIQDYIDTLMPRDGAFYYKTVASPEYIANKFRYNNGIEPFPYGSLLINKWISDFYVVFERMLWFTFPIFESMLTEDYEEFKSNFWHDYFKYKDIHVYAQDVFDVFHNKLWLEVLSLQNLMRNKTQIKEKFTFNKLRYFIIGVIF